MKNYQNFFLTPSAIYRLSIAIIFTFAGTLLLTNSCQRPQNIEYIILNDKNSYFYFDPADFPEDKTSLPIGVFDSGTGGLAVLNDIVEYTVTDNDTDYNPFTHESFIYLADMANMPYGSYALEDNTELLREHIIKNVQFLIDQKYYRKADDKKYMSDKSPVKAIVIACNTATAYGLDAINNFLEKADLDIIVKGVIDAAATGAVNHFSSHENGSIAVLATDGTVRSGAYVNSIEQKKKELGREGIIQIFQQPGLGIAEAIDGDKDFIDKSATMPREGYMGPSEKNENNLYIDLSIRDLYGFNIENGALLYEGDINNPDNLQLNSVYNYIAFHLVSLMEKIKKTDDPQPLRTIILGCTHYPYVEDTITEILEKLKNHEKNGEFTYRQYMADSIVLINPAIKVARQLYESLIEENLITESHYKNSEFFISVPNVLNNQLELREDGAFTYEYKYGRKAGTSQEYVKRIPFNRSALHDDILERLFVQVPLVYEMIVSFNQSNYKTEYLDQDLKIE